MAVVLYHNKHFQHTPLPDHMLNLSRRSVTFIEKNTCIIRICIYLQMEKGRGHLGHEFTRRRARSWCPRLSSWTTSDRAWEQRTWRWFLSMAIRAMVRLASVFILGGFGFLLSRASSFLPIFPLCGALKQTAQETLEETPKMLRPPPQQASWWLETYLCEMWDTAGFGWLFIFGRSFCRTVLSIKGQMFDYVGLTVKTWI